MTIRFSTGLRNMLAQSQGFCGALNRGYMEVYSGSQPITADTLAPGTKLGIVTKASGTLTKETRASATLTVTSTTALSLTALTVGTLPIVPDPGEVVSVAGDTTATAVLIAAAINRNGYAEATSATNVVTVKPRPGCGAAWNGLTLETTGIVCTGSNFASGAASANSLILGVPASGIIQKSTDVWSFNGLAAGTAGWFRFFPSDTTDTGAASTVFPRFDGSCGVGTGDAQLSSLAVSLYSPHTVDVFKMTFPAS